jgi:hypothetical protein
MDMDKFYHRVESDGKKQLKSGNSQFRDVNKGSVSSHRKTLKRNL